MLAEIEGYLRRNHFTEDALQEGMIAAWETMEKHPGQKIGYYARAGKNGAKSYILGKKTTGRGAQGKKMMPTEYAYSEDLLVDLVGSYEDGLAAKVDLARALDKLSDRDYAYVVLRFYEGHTHEESIKRAGVSWTAWHERIKPKLRSEL